MQAAYDEIAEWYDKSVEAGNLLSATVVSHMLELAGDIAGQSLCDIACGQGLLARELAERGAGVTGGDISSRLLGIARRYEDETPLGIRYLLDDAQSLAGIADSSFDGVLCNMALMDIGDINAVFARVWRILRPAGWFVFSITHPCFQPPPGGSYFTEGLWRSSNPNGVRGKVGAHHRTLGTYLNTLSNAGFCLERIAEPQIDGRDTPPILLVLSNKSAITDALPNE
jgi:2-polyprenyl-3-methyl-5-hydroxy-6-metoxy-1,4-benzoquinol methylase